MSGTTDITQDLTQRTSPTLNDELVMVNSVTKAVQAVKVDTLRNFLAAFFSGAVIPQTIEAGAVLGTPAEVQIYYAPAGSYTTPTGVVELTGNLNLCFWNKITWSYMEIPVEVDLSDFQKKEDSFYAGLYATKDEANAAIENEVVGGKNSRAGKVVYIGTADVYEIYIWKNGFTDENLQPLFYNFLKDDWDYLELPNADYLDRAWSTHLDAGNTYYDTRVKASAGNRIVAIKAILSVAGSLNIVLLSMFEDVLYTEAKTGVLGLNTFTITIPDDINEDYYIGLKTIVAQVRTIHPPESMTTCRMIVGVATESIGIDYRIAYMAIIEKQAINSYTNRLLVAESKADVALSLLDGDAIPESLPETDYLDNAWASSLSNGYILYDERVIVPMFNTISSVKMHGLSAGTVDIVLLSMTESVLYSVAKSYLLGVNAFSIDVPAEIEEPYYVGIRGITGTIGTISPPEDLPTRLILTEGTPSIEVGYRYPYMVEIVDRSASLLSRVRSLEIMVKSDTTNLQQQLNSKDVLNLEDRVYTIEETLIFPSGRTIKGVMGKSILQASAGLADLGSLDEKTDILMKGVTFKGVMDDIVLGEGIPMPVGGKIDDHQDAIDKANIGTKNGLLINKSERINIYGCAFSNFDAHGILDTLSGKNFEYGIKLTDNYFHDNYLALCTDSEAEYSTFMGNSFTRNELGLYMNTGNNLWTNNHIDKNRVGAVLGNGYNNSHGSFNACTFNHNALFGLIANGVSAGETFAGCQFWYGHIMLINSKGINITGGQFGATEVFADGALDGGKSQILGVCFSGGAVYHNYNGHTSNLSLKNNFFLSGASASAINN